VSSRIGETFDAIVTGLTSRGTFVRVLKPAVEGLLEGQREHGHGRSLSRFSMTVLNWTDLRLKYRYDRALVRWNAWRLCPLRSDCTR